MDKYRELAQSFCNAIRTFSEKPENLNNMESYLSYHFPVWIEKYAYNPEILVSELKRFSEMEL